MKKLLLGLAVCFLFVGVSYIGTVANARTGDAVRQINFAEWTDLGTLSGCDNAPITAAINCGGTGGFRTQGFDHLKLIVTYTHGSGTATGLTFFLEECDEGHGNSDCEDAADWVKVSAKKTTIGTSTKLNIATPFEIDAAADAVHSVSQRILAKRMRVGAVTGTGTVTYADKVSIKGFLVRQLHGRDQ